MLLEYEQNVFGFVRALIACLVYRGAPTTMMKFNNYANGQNDNNEDRSTIINRVKRVV